MGRVWYRFVQNGPSYLNPTVPRGVRVPVLFFLRSWILQCRGAVPLASLAESPAGGLVVKRQSSAFGRFTAAATPLAACVTALI